MQLNKRIYFDDGAQGFLLLLLIGQFFFNNGIYLVMGGICFAIIVSKLQQPYKPSVFTIIFIYHFMQVSAGIWLSNYLGSDINYRSPNTGMAIALGYVGLMIMFIPIIYFQDKLPTISLHTLKAHAERLSITRTFQAYLVAFFIANSLTATAFLFSGLTQIIFSIIKVKWMLFMLFGFQAILKNKMKKEFYFFIALEFAMGFFSYFSAFKTVLFFIGFIALIFLHKVYLRQLIYAILVLISVFYAGVFWTGIKGEYRHFLNEGQNTQTVNVSKNDAFNKLVELSGSESRSDFSNSVIMFLDRIQYTYHFAKTIDRVPTVIPYQEGKNWGKTIEFVLTPRLLNPGKPTYQASTKTTRYTGISYAGARSGTSVSLGYFADGYIDFGYIGMFIPLLILGLIYGSTYYYFLKNSSKNFLFNYCVVGAMFIEFHAFEMDSTFLLGRLFSTLLTFYLISLFFFPWLIDYLSMPKREVVKEKKEVAETSLELKV